MNLQTAGANGISLEGFQRAPLRSKPPGGLDRRRISAASVVIIGHVILFGMMLRTAPLENPSHPPAPDVENWYEVVKQPDPPKKPIEVDVKKIQPTPVRPEPVRTSAPPKLEHTERVLIATTSAPSETQATHAVEPPTIVEDPGPIGGPPQNRALEAIDAPPPPYPPGVNFTGTVKYRVLVGTNGRPLKVEISQTSGNRRVDRIVRDHIKRRWKFNPMEDNGQVVEAWGNGKIVFTLDG
jgi:periplasmic protein TonB